MKFRNTTLLMVLFAAPAFAFGQSRSVPMLEVNPDARSAAMGGNQYGEARSMLIYSNPTSILYSDKALNVSAATQIYPDADDAGRLMYYGAAASYRVGIHGVQAGFRYLGGYSIPMENGKNLKPADWSADVAYSIRFLDRISVAAGVSLLHSKILKEAYTVAFNLSAYYRNSFNMGINADYVIGVNVANIGPDLNYGKKYGKTKLPACFGAGGELGMDLGKTNRLGISLAGQYYCMPRKAKMFTGNIGAEYSYAKKISLRAGYKYAEHDYSSFAFGAGLACSIFHLDVAHQRGMGENEVNLTLITLGVSF